MASGFAFSVLNYGKHDNYFAGHVRAGWEISTVRAQHAETKESGTEYRFTLPSYGDVFAGTYFLVGADPYENIEQMAFDTNWSTVWTISGPGLKLLHGLAAPVERARLARAIENGVLPTPFRPAFSVAMSYPGRVVRLTMRDPPAPLKMYIDNGFLPPEVHDASPYVRRYPEGDDHSLDMPSYQELSAPAGPGPFVLPIGCGVSFSAIAVGIYLSTAPSKFIAGAITSAGAGAREMAPLDAERSMFGVHGAMDPGTVITVALDASVPPAACVRVLGVRACRAESWDGCLRVCNGKHPPVY